MLKGNCWVGKVDLLEKKRGRTKESKSKESQGDVKKSHEEKKPYNDNLLN